MLKCFLFLLVISQISCVSRDRRDPKKAHLHLSIGTGHLNQGLYPEALSELTTALKFDDENPTIHNNLGIAYFVRNKFSEAEFHLRRAVELDPKYTEARNNLGKILIEMNFIQEAIEQLKIADKDLEYTTPEKTKSNLGIAYFKNSQFQLSKKFLSESLRLRSQNCQTSNYYARVLFELKSFEEASIAFDQASNNCKGEGYDEPVYYAGLTYFKLNKKNLAIARFEEVMASYPNGKYAEQAQQMIDLLKN
ncbi:MAG: tetratricopeptide repeat protein [Bdellovibrionaceae bacterium]|nr:tetratricopeptide repeat protein [Pseudobdellovibrionaceae bacterium]